MGMKRLLIVLLPLFVLMLSGCQFFEVRELEKAFETMNELDSYKMDITVKIDNFAVSSEAWVDGNYEELRGPGLHLNIIELDGEFYTIEENNFELNALYPYQVTEDDEYDDFDTMLTYEFEKDEDYYILKGDIPFFDDVSEIKVLIKDGYVTEMTFETDLEGDSSTITVEYSEFDEVELTIPSYLSIEESEVIDSYSETVFMLSSDIYTDTSIIDGELEDHIHFQGEGYDIDCNIGTSVCNFDLDPIFQYHLEYQTCVDIFVSTDTYIPYIEFANNHPNQMVTPELFEFINLIYRYHYPDES
jgi:hypothetical protein